MDVASVLEWIAVGLGVVYVVLAAKPHVACWPFGIVGSAISVGLFVHARLYSESLLYLAYVVLGVVGWVSWVRHGGPSGEDAPIVRWPWSWHAAGIGGAAAAALLLGGAMGQITDAAMPMVDAFTTCFALLATWMVARKLLENWAYWVVIDAVSVWLYASRGLPVYAGLMAVYTVVAVVGWWRWWQVYQQQG